MSTLVLTTADAVHDVLEGDITLPLSGPWSAHLELSGDLDLSGPVVLTLAGENDGAAADFVGFIRRSKAWQGRTRTVVVGGAGGLLKVLPPRDHVAGIVPVTAGLIAARIALEAGEAIDAASLLALALIPLSRWHRVEGTALAGLQLLAERIGFAWRVLDTGAIWIGLDTFGASDADIGNAFGDDGDDGRVDCAPPVATPRPGTTILDHPIERVTYRVAGTSTRAELLYPVTPTTAQPLAPLVYRETHGADVVAQNSDGTLELKVDDQRIAELRRVPFRPGIPGARLVISAGERVRIRFPDGNPEQVEAFDLDGNPSAVRAIVRVGDSTSSGLLAVAMVAGAPTFTYTPPGGVQQVGVSVTLTGVTTTGSPEIFVR